MRRAHTASPTKPARLLARANSRCPTHDFHHDLMISSWALSLSSHAYLSCSQVQLSGLPRLFSSAIVHLVLAYATMGICWSLPQQILLTSSCYRVSTQQWLLYLVILVPHLLGIPLPSGRSLFLLNHHHHCRTFVSCTLLPQFYEANL